MIDPKVLFQSGQHTITPDTIAANPGMDPQGIFFPNQPRQAVLAMIRDHYPLFQCVLNSTHFYGKKTPRLQRPQFGFEFFNFSHLVAVKHQQLTNLLVAVSEDHVVLAAENHVLLVDTKTNTNHRLASYNSYSLDYEPNAGLICGTHGQSRIFVYDVRGRREAFQNDLGGDNLINSVVFNCDGAPLLVVSANQTHVEFLDLEKMTVARHLPSRAFVNFTAWWPGSRVYCMVMDDVTVEVTDDRCHLGTILTLEGHLDYNFASAFLNESVVATGGQDCSVRLWDLRKTEKEVQLFEGQGREVCTLRYNRRNSTLYSLEKLENVIAFRQSGGVWKVDNFDFIGFAKGMAITPSGDRMILGIHEQSFGGFMSLRTN